MLSHDQNEPTPWPWLYHALSALGIFGLAAGLSTHLELLLPLTLVAAVWAATTWIAHYDRRLAGQLYQHWLAKPVVVWVHRTERIPLVFDEKRPVVQVRPKTDADWQAIEARLKTEIWGFDTEITGLIGAAQNAVRLRNNERLGGPLPPIGAFLLIGKEGLGKRALAQALARELYGQANVHIVETGTQAEPLWRDLIRLATEHSEGAIVLEQFNESPTPFRERFLALLSARPVGVQSLAAPGIFRNWMFFCISHREAREIRDLLAGASPDALADQADLSAELITHFKAVVPFVIPADRQKIADIILKMFRDTCKRRGVELVKVSPHLLLGAVENAVASENFSLVSAQVRRRAESAVAAALARNERTVVISDEPE